MPEGLKSNKWSKEEDLFLLNNLNKSSQWIGLQLGRSEYSVSRRVKRLNYKKIYNQEKHVDSSSLLSESELAYCLGVLASDGSINYKLNKNSTFVKRFALCISIRDVNWLLSVYNLLTGDIVNYRIVKPSIGKTNKVSYSCSLKNFIKIAEDFGITRNKTLTLDVLLDNKSLNFKYYFLRGVVDGDGHVHLRGASVSVISASYKFIQTLQRNFEGRVKKRSYGNYWDFFISKREICKLPIETYMLDRKSIRISDAIKRIKKWEK